MTDATRNILSREALARNANAACASSTAPAADLIDEAALAEAITSGQVGGAALDVFASEPAKESARCSAMENVVCTPHLGASTNEAQENVALAGGRADQRFSC